MSEDLTLAKKKICSCYFVPPGPPKLINIYWINNRFQASGCFKIRSFCDTILVATWLHFGSKNQPKSTRKSIQNPTKIDPTIEVCTSLAPFWGACWGHLGNSVKCYPLLCCVGFFFRFLRCFIDCLQCSLIPIGCH